MNPDTRSNSDSNSYRSISFGVRLASILFSVAVFCVYVFLPNDSGRVSYAAFRQRPPTTSTSTAANAIKVPSCYDDHIHADIVQGAAEVSVDQSTKGASATATSKGAAQKANLIPSTRLWADTIAGKACHDMHPWSHTGISYGLVWNELRPTLLEASYYPTLWKDLDRFRDWVSSLFHFYTVERLRRSQAHPAPTASMQAIMRLIQRRLDDPEHSEPIRIIVMGGSVATGSESHQNPVDLPDAGHSCYGQCAYANRLNHLLNTVLFPDHEHSKYPVFEVENMAVPGTDSQVGSMVLDFRLIPTDPSKTPHIVIWSYSPNDSRDADPHESFLKDKQSFVRAAHNLRECDDDLPLVVLNDDLYGPDNLLLEALEETGAVYKTASWYNLMSVAYSNVARHETVANFNGSQANPFLGTAYDVHMGMGFHMAVAWTLLFNLLGAMHDACSEAVIDAESEASSSWSFEELPTKYRGHYAPTAKAVQEDWKLNLERRTDRCKNRTDAVAVDSPQPKYSTRACTYAFMTMHTNGFAAAEEVTAAFTHVLTENDGWDATTAGDGLPHERIGWQTNRSESSFSLELPNITMETNSLTVLSMKSYGPKWVDSKLKITVEVIPSSPGRPTSTGQFEVDGYHSVHTSVSFPHRFAIPGGIASIGDTIRATFQLVQGSTFKISALGFCNLLAS